MRNDGLTDAFVQLRFQVWSQRVGQSEAGHPKVAKITAGSPPLCRELVGHEA